MSRSSGTGQPLWFMCANRRKGYDRDPAAMHVVKLTGRTKPSNVVRRGRMTATSREYSCSCGHVGWSAHVDLQNLAKVSP